MHFVSILVCAQFFLLYVPLQNTMKLLFGTLNKMCFQLARHRVQGRAGSTGVLVKLPLGSHTRGVKLVVQVKLEGQEGGSACVMPSCVRIWEGKLQRQDNDSGMQ